MTQSLCDVCSYEENGMSGLIQANMHYDKSQPWNIELLKEGQDSVVLVSYIFKDTNKLFFISNFIATELWKRFTLYIHVCIMYIHMF